LDLVEVFVRTFEGDLTCLICRRRNLLFGDVDLLSADVDALFADALADLGVLRWVRSNYPELHSQNILDYIRIDTWRSRSIELELCAACRQRRGREPASLVLSSENVRARARKSTWLGWGLISGRGREQPRAVQQQCNMES